MQVFFLFNLRFFRNQILGNHSEYFLTGSTNGVLHLEKHQESYRKTSASYLFTEKVFMAM
jgi:hypothetical protein